MVIMSTNSQIEWLFLFEWLLLFLLFSPSAISKRVEHGVLLLSAKTDVQWDIILSEFWARHEVDIEPKEMVLEIFYDQTPMYAYVSPV